MTIVVPGTAPVTAGFGALTKEDIIINGQSLEVDVTDAVTDVVLESTIVGASTVTVNVDDPFRNILNSGVIGIGDQLTLNGLSFNFCQCQKSSDQLQFVFESSGVNILRQLTGPTASTTTSDITSFAAGLVGQVPGLGFVGDPEATIFPIDSVGVGSNTYPSEDYWTALQRIATSAGWQCWEYNNTIYFGSDTFFFSQPSVATLQEWTAQVQNMDFDWDYNKPFGNITVTAMTGYIGFAPGQVVTVNNLGFASGLWLVNDMQRDLYSPVATITLQVPQTPLQIVTGLLNPTLADLAYAAAEQSGATSSTAAASGGGVITTSTGPSGGYPNMTVTVNPNPGIVNQSFTVTCHVSGGGVGATPTGIITFQRNGSNMENGAAVKLDSQGTASLTEPKGLANAGLNHIVCTYTPEGTGTGGQWNEVDNLANPVLFTVNAA